MNQDATPTIVPWCRFEWRILLTILYTRSTELQRYPAYSFGWWLMVGAGLFWDKSTGGWFVLREKYCWLMAAKRTGRYNSISLQRRDKWQLLMATASSYSLYFKLFVILTFIDTFFMYPYISICLKNNKKNIFKKAKTISNLWLR
jgi:hypothetical protein